MELRFVSEKCVNMYLLYFNLGWVSHGLVFVLGRSFKYLPSVWLLLALGWFVYLYFAKVCL